MADGSGLGGLVDYYISLAEITPLS